MDEMEKIEKVQKLCEKTGANAEAARNALEECQWDMFEAFLKLDKEKSTQTAGSQNMNGGQQYGQQTAQGQTTGYTEYTTAGTTDYQQGQNQYQNTKSSSFGESVGKCIKWFGNLIQRGMENFLDVERDGKTTIHIPITIFVLLFIFFNVFVLALMVIGLFCGFRYAFTGPDFNSTSKRSDYTEGNSYGDKDSNR
ncbi:MAG: hypothetical protein PHW47_10580 [Lachnospira sp.]|nr:hypothetical protein [Lachnospira sp.]